MPSQAQVLFLLEGRPTAATGSESDIRNNVPDRVPNCAMRNVGRVQNLLKVDGTTAGSDGPQKMGVFILNIISLVLGPVT